MRSVLALVAALGAVPAGPALAQEGAPPAWSGWGKSEVVAASVETKLGLVQPGQAFARQVRRPVRTARLAKDFAFGQGQYAGVVKAGTVLYGENFLTIPPVGVTLPKRRKDDLIWCVAGGAPVLCFRWNGPGDMEYAGVIGGLMFDRAPFGNWHEARGLELVEQPLVLDPPYEEFMVLKVVGENGFVVSRVRQRGEAKNVQDETHYWDDPVERQTGAKLKLGFSPVKNAKGEVTAARVTAAP
jgi:hypothetical protein